MIVCPLCREPGAVRLPVAYAQGTRTGTTVFASFDGLDATGWAVGEYESSTNFAQRLAPPRRAGSGTVLTAFAYKEPGSRLMVWGLALIVVGFFILPLLVGIPMALVGWRRTKRFASDYNETVWPSLFAKWQSEWVCLRCGARWVPTDQATSAAAVAREPDATAR